MAFLKLDCGILTSTIWCDREAREIFITALLMAEPYELREPMPQLEVRTLKETGFIVPVGWYGFIAAAGSGIIRMAGLGLEEGLSALERLGSEDKESRTPDHGGRRLVRVSGGYIALNYDNYRKKDHTAAERSKRYRLRKQTEDKSSRVALVTSRVASQQHHSTITQAEAEVQAKKKTVAAPLLSSEHKAFIQGWSENFKVQFGFDYAFDGPRDGKAVKELLKIGILRLDLLEIAKNAWKRSELVKSFNCGQAATIHGFKAYLNQIRTELSHEPGLTGKINQRLVGVSRNNAVNNYAEAAKRKIEQQNLARQVAGSGNLPPSEAKGTGGSSSSVLPGIMEQP